MNSLICTNSIPFQLINRSILNLETLAAVFRREMIVPSIVQSMNNEKIERLDVTATGDRVRLRELCKEDEENNSRSSFGSRSVGSPL